MFKSVNGGRLPTKGSKYSACVDVYANEDVTIDAGDTKIVGLGIALDEELMFERLWSMSKKEAEVSLDLRKISGTKNDGLDYEAMLVNFENFKISSYIQLMLRSSLGAKGLILPNGVGVIDMDYRDEIKMIVHNPIHADNLVWEDDKMENLVIGYSSVTINRGDRIGQMALLEHQSYLFGIDSVEVRVGGFGSTGER